MRARHPLLRAHGLASDKILIAQAVFRHRGASILGWRFRGNLTQDFYACTARNYANGV
jgi:hypothetical protein